MRRAAVRQCVRVELYLPAARSIEEPLRQIVENAGEGAAVVLNQVKGGKGAYGATGWRVILSPG